MRLTLSLFVAAAFALLAFSAATLAANKPSLPACQITQVIGWPMTQQAGSLSGSTQPPYGVRLMPFAACDVNSVPEFAWTYSAKQGNWLTSGMDSRFIPDIPLTTPKQRVSVTLTVSAAGARRGTCSFVINKPPVWPFPRYVWPCG